jgi:energy-coupling factor transporter ATP-binding protein EcfA2
MSLDGFDPEQLFIRGVLTGNLAGYLAGRTTEIEEVANRLAASGQSCVIFGERGVGKSTVAQQVSSLLLGENTVFSKESSLSYGREKNFRPCMARVSDEWETAGDLLLECVTSDSGPDSFVGRYKTALTNELFATEFQVKFGFNLATVFTGEAGARIGLRDQLKIAQTDEKLQSSERLKRRIFQHFINRARESDPSRDPKIIFFVDEMDRKPSLSGLGTVVKDINDVQFCFIGIADTIDDIIVEHESAGRKLTGGGVKIPTLSDDEINWIFDNATHMSSDAVIFTKKFRDKVIEYAEGMPWIAQHVGFEAVFANLRQARKRGDEQLVIDIDAFRPAMKATIELYRKIFNERFDIEKTLEEAEVTGPELLRVLLRNRLGMSEAEIKNGLPVDKHNLKRFIPKTLKRFEESGVIRSKLEKYFFRSALLRIFTRYYIDEIME